MSLRPAHPRRKRYSVTRCSAACSSTVPRMRPRSGSPAGRTTSLAVRRATPTRRPTPPMSRGRRRLASMTAGQSRLLRPPAPIDPFDHRARRHFAPDPLDARHDDQLDARRRARRRQPGPADAARPERKEDARPARGRPEPASRREALADDPGAGCAQRLAVPRWPGRASARGLVEPLRAENGEPQSADDMGRSPARADAGNRLRGAGPAVRLRDVAHVEPGAKFRPDVDELLGYMNHGCSNPIRPAKPGRAVLAGSVAEPVQQLQQCGVALAELLCRHADQRHGPADPAPAGHDAQQCACRGIDCARCPRCPKRDELESNDGSTGAGEHERQTRAKKRRWGHADWPKHWFGPPSIYPVELCLSASRSAPGSSPSRGADCAQQLAKHNGDARQPRQGDDARSNCSRHCKRPTGAG